MLALKQSLDLTATKKLGGWVPTDESSLLAWYKKDTLISTVIGKVDVWGDSSTNSHTMEQADNNERPTLSSQRVHFDGGDNLQTTTQMTLADEFVIGLRIDFTETNNGTFLGDNTSANELFKIQSSNLIRMKNANGLRSFTLPSGDFDDDYIVIARDSSNDLYLYRNGAFAVTGGSSLSGDCLIDTIGARNLDTNGFTGDITEIQIYNSYSTALISKVNDSLSTL